MKKSLFQDHPRLYIARWHCGLCFCSGRRYIQGCILGKYRSRTVFTDKTRLLPFVKHDLGNRKITWRVAESYLALVSVCIAFSRTHIAFCHDLFPPLFSAFPRFIIDYTTKKAKFQSNLVFFGEIKNKFVKFLIKS